MEVDVGSCVSFVSGGVIGMRSKEVDLMGLGSLMGLVGY